MIFDFVQIKDGFGKHADTLSPQTLVDYGRNFYILLLFYNLGLGFFKLSLLAFYIRVFSVVRVIRTGSFIISVAVVAWMIATEFLLIFRCHPVDMAWTGTPQQQSTQCISMDTVFVAQAAPTIFFDVIILVLPLKDLWSLKLNRGQKAGVTVVFLLGFLVTIISIVRLKTIFSTGSDLTCKYILCVSSILYISAANLVTIHRRLCRPWSMVCSRASNRFALLLPHHIWSFCQEKTAMPWW